MATSEEVHEKLTRLDKGQPGSVLRALRLTRDRLTGERGSEIMLKGPTAERLTERVNELVGNVGLVGASVFDLSEEDREHANRAPIALSIPLHDELVRASSTLDRLLGKAVELRNWREVKEAELASLVETSDPAANAIRDQRRAEIAGEITLVSQQETGLLGDVYEVSNAIRQSLEERTQLLSNLIRLGLGPMPTPQVSLQQVTAEQLSNQVTGEQLACMDTSDLATRWEALTRAEKKRLIDNDWEKLRNLNGIDGPSREAMQEKYIKSIIDEGGPRLKKLEELDFVKDGRQTRRFVYLTLQQNKNDVTASYVTAHGCKDYNDLQYVIEGTYTDPNSPKGLGNLGHTDRKADSLKKHHGTCRTFLVVRNVDFPDNFAEAALSSKFSRHDEKTILDLMGGLTLSGAGKTATSVRMHSAGNSFLPALTRENRDKFGVHMDVAIMDDPAMDTGQPIELILAMGTFDDAYFSRCRDLPDDIEIMYVIQEGAAPNAIRDRFGTDAVQECPNVTTYTYKDITAEYSRWLASKNDVPVLVRNPLDLVGEPWDIVELTGILFADAIGVDTHSQGWYNPIQWYDENQFIRESLQQTE
jgi:hypothetical protein